MKNKWLRKDESGYMRLDPELAYPGTDVWVYQQGYKRWSFMVVNNEDSPQNDRELSRTRGRARTDKAWKSPQSAKNHAYNARLRKDWLEEAGIVFKDS